MCTSGNPGEFQLWSIQEAMDGIKRKGYAWAIAAGLNAAAAAIAAKFFSYPLVRYGLVVLFNVTMWGCYVQSLKALSSLQATVTNFATNFLSSGLAGFFLFQEMMSVQWLAGALLIVIGVIILSKSSIERKISID
uniref:EamA domain-containing protein n=1 Tax=Rhizophora mucronata TaxID=61149 RepID=A0A2P2K817_RHIMU